jgi:hypothetical protein
LGGGKTDAGRAARDEDDFVFHCFDALVFASGVFRNGRSGNGIKKSVENLQGQAGCLGKKEKPGGNDAIGPRPDAQTSGQNIPINAPIVSIETRISSHELARDGVERSICEFARRPKTRRRLSG